jgi:hypothetical protein
MSYKLSYTVLDHRVDCWVDTKKKFLTFEFDNCEWKVHIKDNVKINDRKVMDVHCQMVTLKVVYRFRFDKYYKVKHKKTPMS